MARYGPTRFRSAAPQFRILAINDDAYRDKLCLPGDTSILGVRRARELDTLARRYGKSACIVGDDGSTFTSWAIQKWTSETGGA